MGFKDKETEQDYMEANRKERSAMTKRWADKNRERVRAYNKAYRATPEAKAKRAARRANNKAQMGVEYLRNCGGVS